MSTEQDWRTVAADMIEAKGFAIDQDSNDTTLVAADFIWEHGILYMGDNDRAEVVALLRKEAAK